MVSPYHRVGIIGAGQLGMLLCQAARRLGVQTTVLADDTTNPAVHSADTALVAAMDDPRAVQKLIAHSDVITFEFEAVPDSTLDALRAAVESGNVAVNPAVATLSMLKDKGLQKSWLHEQGLPTLPFVLTEADADIADLDGEAIQPPLVQKARRGGYDGKGVQILRTPSELAGLWPVASVFEPALENCVEVAVVVARGASGELAAYPPVTMHFDPELNAVSTVTSPGALESDMQERCHSVACEAVAALGAVGVFAVELFVSTQGELFINEISPRVHNSGHLTIEGFLHDQFEQHIRAITGQPLAPVEPLAGAAVMLNLLYEDSMAAAHTGAPYAMPLDTAGHTVIHWYGKHEARPGRKMGHITAIGDSPAAALELASAGLATLRSGKLHPPASKQQPEAS
jgi:5-(carboxyamino)imidazole ribonucleotide synthase